MASTAAVSVSVTVNDGTKDTVKEAVSVPSVSVSGFNGKRETLTLGVGATTITPPAGAKGVLLLIQTQVNLTLKGIAGDTGVALQGATANGLPAFIPLAGAGATFVLNSTAGGTIEAVWF
jgi:hypothetical protein